MTNTYVCTSIRCVIFPADASICDRFSDCAYYRIAPVLNLDEDGITDPYKIEQATTAWINSCEGRLQFKAVVEGLLGVPLLTVPPSPPADTVTGYNVALDDERPDEITACLE